MASAQTTSAPHYNIRCISVGEKKPAESTAFSISAAIAIPTKKVSIPGLNQNTPIRMLNRVKSAPDAPSRPQMAPSSRSLIDETAAFGNFTHKLTFESLATA